MIRKVKIKMPDNYFLDGYFHIQKNSSTLFIVCHGYGGSKDDFLCKNLAFNLSQKGEAVFRFDFSQKNGIDFFKKVNELKTVIDYFSPQFKNIVVIGPSYAAFISSLAAFNNKKIKAFVSINGLFYPFHLSGINLKYIPIILGVLLTAPFSKVNRRLLSAYIFDNLRAKIESLSLPVLIIYGDSDEILDPKNQSIKFYRRLCSTKKKIVCIKNADHTLSKNNSIEKAAAAIISFVQNLN